MAVTSRDWRHRTNEVRHTREVRDLPPEAMELLQEMAAKINKLELAVFDLTSRLEPIESAQRLLADEARRRVGR